MKNNLKPNIKNKKGVILKRIGPFFLIVLLLFLACSKYYKCGERSDYTALIEGILHGSLGGIETYLIAPQDILIALSKQGDFSCEMREATFFLENISGIPAYKQYEFNGSKLSESDSTLLSQDLARWKSWYQDNKEYLFLSRDKKTLRYKRKSVERREDLSAIRCRPVF